MTTTTRPEPNPLRKGWTLIELLTTVIILTISAYILIPYASSGQSSSGQSVARMAVTEILAAQRDAVSTQGYRRIHFFADGTGWCVEELESSQLMNAFDFATADFAEDAIESQGQGQQSITRFSEDNRFNTISIQNVLFDGANPNVTFDPTGGIIATDGSPSTGGSFEIQSGDLRWEVQLAPLTGKVTVVTLGGAP
jgi:type II secretory pathway pseudopilin PulG